MKISEEILAEVKNAKSADELKALLGEKNIVLTDAQSEELFTKLKANELTDEDLEQVSGGLWLHRRLDQPPFI